MQMMQGISRFAPGPTPRKCAPAPAAGDGDEDDGQRGAGEDVAAVGEAENGDRQKAANG
jgi:hypothetical protein